jgi:hypothetical protein
MENKKTMSIGELQRALKASLVVQIALLMFSALIFDGGATGHLLGVAMAGYWLWVGWLAIRRRNNLTQFDAIMIRIGYFVWIMVTILVGMGIGYLTENTNLL